MMKIQAKLHDMPKTAQYGSRRGYYDLVLVMVGTAAVWVVAETGNGSKM